MLSPFVNKILKLHNLHKIVDLGSGNGYLAGFLQEQGFNVVGFERDKEGVRISSEKYKNIKFYNLGVEDDPRLILRGELFDAVVSTEVVEHLYKPSNLLSFANLILKDKGIIILSTPYHGWFKNILISLFNKWDFHHHPNRDGGHIKFWSKKTLTKLLNDYGYDLIEFHGAGRIPFLWKSMILVAKKK
jgi:2-polyprenyl-3-methyl-5-hydroxy-6-metoxy-1,4-benzoquinol methylase